MLLDHALLIVRYYRSARVETFGLVDFVSFQLAQKGYGDVGSGELKDDPYAIRLLRQLSMCSVLQLVVYPAKPPWLAFEVGLGGPFVRDLGRSSVEAKVGDYSWISL